MSVARKVNIRPGVSVLSVLRHLHLRLRLGDHDAPLTPLSLFRLGWSNSRAASWETARVFHERNFGFTAYAPCR